MTENSDFMKPAIGSASFHAPLQDQADTILAASLWLLFYLCLRFFHPLSGGGFAEAGFIYAMTAAGVLYQKAKKRPLRHMSKWILGYELALATSCPFFRNSDLAAVQILVLASGIVLFLQTLSSGSLAVLYERPLYALFWRPDQLMAAGLPLFFNCFRRRSAAGKDSQRTAGFFLAIPLFLLCFALLSAGDDSFRLAVQDFQQFLNQDEFWHLLLSLVFAVLTYSLYAMASENSPAPVSSRSCSWSFFEPSLILCICLYAFYLVIAIPGLAAFDAAVSEPAAVSGFAREGFFQLCAVAAINFLLILVSNSVSASHPHQLLMQQKVLTAETLAILILSAVKMSIYINAYGWTLRRFNVFAFLLLLACVLILFLLGRGTPQQYVKSVICASAAALLILSWCNEGSLITRFNVTLCESGKIPASASIFGSAASAYQTLHSSENPQIISAAKSYLAEASDVRHDTWNLCTEEMPLTMIEH